LVEETNRARLYPKRDGYSVIHDGKLLVSKSRNPECDAARALLAGGITGKLHLFDAGSFQVTKKREPWGIRYIYTPRPPMLRTIINIEKAAELTVEETGNGPRLRRFRGVESEPTASGIAA
jgi:hypothetical protein